MNFFRGIILQQALLFITMLFLPFIIMAQSTSIEKVGLQLGWKHQFQYAGFYIAKEYGFYQDVDLDVNIKEFDHSIDIINEVVSEQINFGIGKSSLLIERYNGKPVVALGALYQSSPSVLVTTNPSFKALKDIRGKNIMVTDDAIKSASIISMLLSNGINGNDFILQKHSFNYKDLIEGKTDAMACYLSNELFNLAKKNIPYQVFNPKDYGYDFYGDILFTSENEIVSNPERVRKFYAASKKGWLWAFENIEKTAQLIYDKYNTQNKSLESLIYEGQVLKKLALIKGIDFGHISINKFNHIAEVFRLGNLLDKVDSLTTFVDPLNLNRTEVKIGVLAGRGIGATLKRWTPLINYLNTKLDNYYFTVVPLDFNQISVDVANNKIDFFITNTLNYVQIEHLYGASRIATLLNNDSSTQDKFSEYGGVIFTKVDNQDINSIEDIKGKSFAAVDKHSFGGWIMAYEEFINHGMTQDDVKLTFLKTHDAVVEAVLKGQVESGTVRTDTFERLVNEGKIELSDIKVINVKHHKGFPYLASTQLYPEWPFSKLKHTPNKLANDVLSVLLNISSEHPVFKEVKADEWTVPLNYNAVHGILKKLHISPYDFDELNLVDVFKKYTLIIYAITLGFIVLIFRLLYIKKLNKTLDGYNFKLDQEVRERTINLKKANKKLKILARTDPLTGINNRGYFFNQGNKYFNIAIRNKTPLHQLMLDLDFFKGINDKYGHHVGDLVLKEFTQTVEKTLRNSDLFGRIGGEEFSIILQDTSIEGAKLFAERIRENIEAMEIISANIVIKVTVSIGLVTLKEEDNINELLQKADLALYEAKTSGRNKYIYME
jgi:polar amino acid transport system substrate-binding protein